MRVIGSLVNQLRALGTAMSFPKGRRHTQTRLLFSTRCSKEVGKKKKNSKEEVEEEEKEVDYANSPRTAREPVPKQIAFPHYSKINRFTLNSFPKRANKRRVVPLWRFYDDRPIRPSRPQSSLKEEEGGDGIRKNSHLHPFHVPYFHYSSKKRRKKKFSLSYFCIFFMLS